VFTGAADIPGYAIASALLVAPFEKLITEIALISGLTPDHVMPALEILTYGRDTTHPDPALQPFMPLGDQVALPCMLTVSNDMERNFLTLLARVRPKDFHRGSHAFELQMISEILGAVHEKGWHVRERVLIPGRPDLGDLDILLCDPTQALLLELRWTIPPAEPKEIFHRSNELQGKQAQLLRKLDGLTPATLEHLSGVPQKAGIALAGAVVLEGWAGSVVPDEVKVINLQLLLRGIQHTASLADLATWITTGDWLPEAGRHFREQRAHATMGDLKVGWVGMSLTAVGRWFVELATLSGHDRRLQEKLLTEYTIFFERLQKQRPDLMFLCEACLHHGQLIEQVGIALRLHMPATRTDGAYHEATLTVRLPLDEPPFALVEVGTARSVKDFRKRLRQAGVTHTEYLAKIGDLMGQQQLRESLTALEIAPQSRAQPLIGHILYSIVDGALLVAFGWRHEVNGFLNVPHNLS
jgi:hypothetical protein